MSYEEDYRSPFKAKCACGKGIVRYFKIHSTNDWGQEREYDTEPVILCDECSKIYHIESDYFGKYLLPEGFTFKIEEPTLEKKYQYTEKEKFILKHSEEDVKEMIADMTAPKHRYIKDLTNEKAIFFAQKWACLTRKKSLAPMIQYLEGIRAQYFNLKKCLEEKQPYVKEYDKMHSVYMKKYVETREKGIKLDFEYDSEYVRDETKKREQYELEHEYDDFEANVHYDESFKKDFVGHCWDTLHIDRCIDNPYLILRKEKYLKSSILITKKYEAHCTVCGRIRELVSSNLKAEYEEGVGYKLLERCDCHPISSFEVKVMSILNYLGVSYEREVMFDGLTGELGHPLRFDFVLYKESDDDRQPIYDLAIELQGPHHYESGYYDKFGDFVQDNGIDGKNRLEKQQRNDGIKSEFCEQNDIVLEIIKYTNNDYERLENRLKKILKEHGYNYMP